MGSSKNKQQEGVMPTKVEIWKPFLAGIRKRKTNYDFMPDLITKDNDIAINRGSGSGSGNKIRVPSLKRSKATWRKFYALFPFIQGKKTWYGAKLKKLTLRKRK